MHNVLRRYGLIILMSAGILLLVTGCGSRQQSAMVSGEELLQEKGPVAQNAQGEKEGLPLEGGEVTQEGIGLEAPTEEQVSQVEETVSAAPEPQIPSPPMERQPFVESRDQITEQPIGPTGVPTGGPEPEAATSQLTFSPSTPSFPGSSSSLAGPPTPPSTVPPLSFSPEGPALPLGLTQAEETQKDKAPLEMAQVPAGRDRGAESEPPQGLTFEDFLPELPPVPGNLPSSLGSEAQPGMEQDRGNTAPESGRQMAKVEPSAPSHEEQVQLEKDGIKPLGELPMGVSDGEVVDSGLAPVFFDFDQYTIRPDAASILEANAKLLKTTYADRAVLIEGHCDERGTQEYNFVLGDRRARAVKTYLVDLGVADSRIQTVSYGEDRPFCLAHTPSCWQENRRGQFVLQ